MTSPPDSPPALVTVVVPAYNAEAFIERTLRTAIDQSYDALDIVVIDDGSTDRTRSIVESMAASDPRIRVITTPNSGVAAARNRGIEHARGDYVAFLDADDLWHPLKVELQMRRLAARGDDPDWCGVYTLHRFIDLDDTIMGDGRSFGASGFVLCRHLVMRFVGNGSSLLVRREAALAVGGFDPAWVKQGLGGCEDLDFELKLAARYKIDVVPEYLVGYRVYEGNMSSNRLRMGRATVAITRRHATINPELSGRTRRMAMALAHRYAFFKALEVRAWRNAGAALLDMLYYDPVYTVAYFAEGVAKRAARGGRRRPTMRGPQFLAADLALRLENRPVHRDVSRLMRLEAEDEALEPLYLARRRAVETPSRAAVSPPEPT